MNLETTLGGHLGLKTEERNVILELGHEGKFKLLG